MFAQYQYEIIAAILLVVVLVIVFLLKKKQPSQAKKDAQESLKKYEAQKREDVSKRAEALFDEKEKEVQKPEKEETAVEEKLQEEEKEKESEEIMLGGSEEGDFGVEESPQEEPTEAEIERVTIKKRDVPAHGKISKENFKEFSGERILVAEDNLINQKVLTGLLAGSGIDITMANDGQEALDILEKDDDFLMILMDAHMPRVDGFEATRIIRANPKYDHILVVALSGDTAADDIKKMREAGMAEQLEKPLRMDALYDIFYAYAGMNKVTSKESVEDDADLVEVVVTKNLDGDKGLEICGGDEAFYHEILDEFIATYDNSSRKLETLLENGELEHADRVLLDIIGITANIGAKPLHDIAEVIKESLSDTEGKSYLTFIPAYQTHLKNLIADIKAYK